MKKCAALLCAVTLMGSVPVAASAQSAVNFFVGGGLTTPISDFGKYANAGFMGLAGLSRGIGDGSLWLGAEGLYGRNSHEGDAGDATNLFGGNAFLGVDLGDSERTHGYLYGTGGLLVHQYSPGDSGFDSESETKPSFGGAIGVGIPTGGGTFWVEGKLLATSETKLLAILAGFTFGN